MVVNDTGARGKPIIANPPRTIGDMQAIADYAAAHGAFMAGHATARLALDQDDTFDGLHWWETDTRTTYVYDSGNGGWVNAGAARSTANSGVFTPSDGWAIGPNSSQYLRVMADTNWVYASFVRTGAPITVNAVGDIKNVAVGKLTVPPSWQVPFSSGLSGRLAAFVADTSGLVQLSAISPGATIATGDSLSFGGPYPYL